MDALKRYLLDNFEATFILIVLIVVSAIVWLVEYKLSFLNFFYIPVLLSSYYLGVRSGVLGAVFVILLIAMFVLLYPASFQTNPDLYSMWATLLTWAGFLILTAVIVGFTHRRLQEKITETLRAKAEASGNAELLQYTLHTIQEFESEMDSKIEERTRVLEEKNRNISAHKEKVEEALYSTMDPAVVKLMIENRIRTENRRISIMFTDLKGFTQYSQDRSAEVVITELNKYLADMETVLLQYYSHIDKYMGDGIMAEFGAPIRYEKHALLSVAAGWKMQQRIMDRDYPFQSRIGIATGVATTGIIGAKRQTFTAFGDTVNLAARIEGLCVPGIVTVDEATYLDCKDLFNFRPISDVTSSNQVEDPELIAKINELLPRLKKHPDRVNLRLVLSKLLIKANDPERAEVHLKQAMKIDPDNVQVKILYAENSLNLEKVRDLNIEGRRGTVRLYEVMGITNPLEKCRQLPVMYLESLQPDLGKLVSYPEDLILPVECIDGSVGFSRLVGVTAYLIADQLKLVDKEKHNILEAGYLCEFGKTIVPENILNRNGSLSEDEFAQIHMHPREGVRKLKALGYENDKMLELIATHHENFNGSGYPMGISGDKIPLGARILAVAEAYVSLTSKRPYRDPWEARAALQEIEKYTVKGKFDPEVVNQLTEIVARLESQAA